MIRALSFIELTVADWHAAVAWYSQLLGLKIELQAGTDGFALLRAGSTCVALKAGQPQPGTVLIAFEVDDLANAVEHLQARGVVVEETIKISHEGYRRAIIRDLEGYRISLFDWHAASGTSKPNVE
jgi:predicted enzyme related to lactoylglutathione lyase